MSVGSFVNVCVWRLPGGESLAPPKSRCPQCGTPITPRDSVPVVRRPALRGRCRACKGRSRGGIPSSRQRSNCDSQPSRCRRSTTPWTRSIGGSRFSAVAFGVVLGHWPQQRSLAAGQWGLVHGIGTRLVVWQEQGRTGRFGWRGRAAGLWAWSHRVGVAALQNAVFFCGTAANSAGGGGPPCMDGVAAVEADAATPRILSPSSRRRLPVQAGTGARPGRIRIGKRVRRSDLYEIFMGTKVSS